MATLRSLLKNLINYQPDEESTATNVMPVIKPAAKREDDIPEYHYWVDWSSEDNEYVATVTEFPSLSWLDSTEKKALAGIKKLVESVEQELKSETI